MIEFPHIFSKCGNTFSKCINTMETFKKPCLAQNLCPDFQACLFLGIYLALNIFLFTNERFSNWLLLTIHYSIWDCQLLKRKCLQFKTTLSPLAQMFLWSLRLIYFQALNKFALMSVDLVFLAMPRFRKCLLLKLLPLQIY